MQLNPYLSFNGQCEAAFRFYEACLGGRLLMMLPFGATPMAAQTPEAFRGKIAHARLAVGDQLLMGSDAPPDCGGGEAKGFSVTLGIADPGEAERVFHALAEGGAVRMPLQKTFWAERFGMLTDRFGIPWMVNWSRRRPEPGCRPRHGAGR
jgi:PhnB protein